MIYQARSRIRFQVAVTYALMTLFATGADRPAGPDPSVPDGGRSPGDYPNFTVTAANWVMDASAVTDITSALRDEVKMNLAGQGPLPWSLTEFGQGRYAPRLNVADPQAAASNLGVLPFDITIDGTAYEWQNDRNPWAPNAAAWRPHPAKGVLMVSVRKNGQEWNDGEPFFHGVVSTPFELSGGEGYSLIDGTFGPGDIEVAVGKAGQDSFGSLDTSVAWFPYDQGWLGGYVASADFEESEWIREGFHHPSLPADPKDMIVWTREFGAIIPPVTLRLPGVNSQTDGMLFTLSIESRNTNTRITAADPNADGSGWEVMIRPDTETDHTFGEESSLSFAFLYVPYDSGNLIGGHVRGNDASNINGRGNYTIKWIETGRYELAIPNKKATDGMLLLGAAGRLQGRPTVIGRNFLSYEPATDDKFIIESRYFRGENDQPLEDTDFYFAWVDFASPLAPPGFEMTLDPPTITTHPVSASIEIGSDVTFTVEAAGVKPFIYRWSFNGTAIPEATEASFAVTNASLSDAGDYQVSVTNAGGQATSNIATLKVLAPPEITQQPTSVNAAVGDSVQFNIAATGTPPLAFQWQKNGVDIPGATSTTLNLQNITIEDAAQYRARVSNEVKEVFSTTERLTLQAIASPPRIDQQPADVIIEAGQTATFQVSAAGSPPLTYQWQFNKENITGATTRTLTLSNVQSNNMGRYRVIVTNPAGTLTSNPATLTVTAPPPVVDPPIIALQPTSNTVDAGQAVRFQVIATGEQLNFQWQKNGTDIPGATSSTFQIIATTALDAGQYQVIISNPGGSTRSNTVNLIVTPASPPATQLSLTSQPLSQTATPGEPVTFTVVAQGQAPLSYQWQLGAFNIPGAHSSSFTIASVQETDQGSYRVIVTDATASVISEAAILTISIPPIITLQPQSQTITEGDTVTFSVTAQGTPSLSFQWQFNGFNIPGARAQTFSVSGVQTADQGNYQVVVTDSQGSTTSEAATLTVIDQPDNSLMITNVSLTGNTLNIIWNSGPGIVLQVKANIDDPFWQDVPGTKGQSSAQQLALGLSAYFRLIQR
ncbi:MAG: Endoglucanase C [Verrucomicrobia subdivision 3 bacterium]|nr:Endoglucanase C [Limisphaerales bacterium]MCS1413448.1 Endoglucanase C [Limisphaerales bacterium]